MTNEQIKEVVIKTIELYLEQHKIDYIKNISDSGSIYYHLKMWDGEPKIRVSDHPYREIQKLCSLNIIYTNIGKNTPSKKVKNRIIRNIEEMLRNNKLYKVKTVLRGLHTSSDFENKKSS